MVTGIFGGTVTGIFGGQLQAVISFAALVCILSDHPLISQETSGTFIPHFKTLVCTHKSHPHPPLSTHVFGSSCSDIQLVGKTVVLLEGRIGTQYRTKLPAHYCRYILLHQKHRDKGNTLNTCTHTHTNQYSLTHHPRSLSHTNVPKHTHYPHL